MEVLGNGAAGEAEVRKRGNRVVGVDYPAARQATTLAMKAEDLMFTRVDDVPALLKMGPIV